ncbi:serine/threonine protein kinase YPK1 [Sugiyamaella lignohabitans]|uniref:non-specific serine/threonine protein kinase n=1 Tax=Sugiyamaella lignohabitans TaxID=796027 RepID=A0A167E8K8_9ASCO|nr:serine/threonine protein kinase YPK1 [Sugiyamaella lignohabitans]ANB13773.1 serine/threonine protein kinase YPK1 [Sugiyamaella lignohabitans]
MDQTSQESSFRSTTGSGAAPQPPEAAPEPKLTNPLELKETHLSAAFSPRSSASSSSTNGGADSSPNGKSGASSGASSTSDLAGSNNSNRTPVSFVSVTTGHHSPGRKIPNSSASSLETISGNNSSGAATSGSPSVVPALSSSVSSSVSLNANSTNSSSGQAANPAISSASSSSSAAAVASASAAAADAAIKEGDPATSTSTITPGLLSVSITKAVGLSLPPGNVWPNYILNATNSSIGAGSVSGSIAPGGTGSGIGGVGSLSNGNSISPRKQQLSSPSQLHQLQRDKQSPSNLGRRRPPPIYIVLEYDKTQVILDAMGGTVDGPIWDKVSNFDVSRIESLSIQVFAKIPVTVNTDGTSSVGAGGSVIVGGESPFTPPRQSLGDNGTAESTRGGNLNSEALRKKGYQEIFLGTCKIDANLSKTVICDGWLPLSSGTGKIQVRIEFKANKNNKHLTIEDFDLLKVVGKGSFGKVMQVRKIDTRRIYALKTIRKAHIISRSEVNHTLAERTVLAQIDNPFIVPLKFSFQSPEKLYLVLAFVNGGELFHHLQREGRFDLNRSRFYTAELLCALECLHEYNVIYRDLKPENILLDYTGHIALCDFGLCKLNMAGQEKTNTFCGTPEYLAPELLLGQGYTKVVDWWTLGVLFYEMLTGLPPFYDQDTNEMYRKILQDPLRFPDDMDREARSLLTGLLNRDPKKRLGVNGAAEIKAHPFFAQIDWKRLMNKKYAAPFKPSVESATDTSNFDQEFTSEVPTDSVVEKDFYLSESVQQQFGGWTYTNTDSKLASSGRW